jgi:geranylgeranyl diphosphate synthase type I
MSINLTNLTNLTKIMLPAVRAEMQAILKADQHPPIDHLHGMMQYHMGWLDADFQQAGAKTGKHIRPLLLLLTVEAAGGAWTQAVPAAAAIELLHNFSLIHDDIEDNSPTRRGRETLWHIWGIPLAINAGDAMFAAAHLALGRLIERDVSAHIVVQAFRRFDETCIALTQGQHADMQFETRDDVQVEEYISMITGKTSVLLSLCAELGALIAGCEAETVAHYAQFGLNLGLAFQVQDDILGIWGMKR